MSWFSSWKEKILAWVNRWLAERKAAEQRRNAPPPDPRKVPTVDYPIPKPEPEPEPTDPPLTADNGVPLWSKLKWIYGGVNASKATLDPSATLRNVKFDSKKVTYQCNPKGWPRSGKTNGLACLFVLQSDGSWQGGKFEHARAFGGTQTREWKNIYDHYHRGSKAWVVPSKGQKIAFVIVKNDLKKHSTIAIGVWK